MKRKTKILLGISVWFAIGFTFFLVYKLPSFVAYVIGTYIYLTFVLPYVEEKDDAD